MKYNTNPILKAAQFAKRKHMVQTRLSGEPYIFHPARVAAQVAIHPGATEEMVAAAFLHDVLEDCDTSPEDLREEFGEKVSALVREVTNPSTGSKAPRAEQKAMDREFLAKASREAKIIKMLDRIDNLRDVDGRSPAFTQLYVEESRALLEVIMDADQGLGHLLQEEIDRLSTNSHEGLLDAIDAIEPWLELAIKNDAFKDCMIPKQAQYALNRARAAVAKARDTKGGT